jgi:hypothetical protein
LNVYAILLVETGRPEEALAISEQAVGLYANLAEANPGVYLRNYIQSLTIQGRALVTGFRFREAIRPLVEAFTTGQHLPEHAPDIVEEIADLLRRAYAGNADGVNEEFRAVTGKDVPGWAKQPPATYQPENQDPSN